MGGDDVIVLDTHMWYWWVGQSDRLTPRYRELIDEHRDEGLGVSVISCWEVAKKNALGKLELDRSIDEWMPLALQTDGVRLLSLTAEIVVESTRLPGDFRSDPADEMIVATARVHNVPLLTADRKILDYEFVERLS